MAPTANIRNDDTAATMADGFSRGSTPSSWVRWKCTALSSSRWISSAARPRGVLGHAHVHEHGDEFDLLGVRMALEGQSLGAHLGVDLFVGGRDGRIFAERHRERAGEQARDAAEHDGLRARGGGDAGDERGVADQSVHRAERRRTQPPTCDVGVRVVDLVGKGNLGRLRGAPVVLGHDRYSTPADRARGDSGLPVFAETAFARRARWLSRRMTTTRGVPAECPRRALARREERDARELSTEVFRPHYTPNTVIARAKVAEQMKIMAAAGAAEDGFKKEHGGNGDVGAAVTRIEMLAMSDLSLMVKAGVQWGLFGGAVENLGTERHHEAYVRRIIDLDLRGLLRDDRDRPRQRRPVAGDDGHLRPGHRGVRHRLPHAVVTQGLHRRGRRNRHGGSGFRAADHRGRRG